MRNVFDNKKTCKQYRFFVLMLLLAAILLFGVLLWRYVEYEIPDRLLIYQEDLEEFERNEQKIEFHEPFLTYEPCVEASQNGNQTLGERVKKSGSEVPAQQVSQKDMVCYLFGILPLKTVEVQAVDRPYVYASGSAVGIYMETEGVHVIDCGELRNQSGIVCSPAKHIIQPGDYIRKVNDRALESKKQLIQLVKQSEGKAMKLEILRGDYVISLMLEPVLTEDGSYKLGIWVRDNVQGIGTMTYIDPKGRFGALGHGIKDSDTGMTLNISNGVLYTANIVSVQKGVQGTPGELQGTINYGRFHRLGVIEQNKETGIAGELTQNVSEQLAKKSYPIGFKQEIETGKATILCGEGLDVKEYAVEITDITLNSKDSKKGLRIKVTDETLLDKTGGIVQGMSGSPIIQNGKLVGAVTHVCVN